MAYNGKLADRIRKVLAGQQGLSERKMFGGIAFMLRGKMCCGVVKDDLVVRVGPKLYEEALAEAHARPMDFTGRPLRGFVFIAPAGYKTDQALVKWVRRTVKYARSLPPK
jgi:TfoX/Sxy family transcriptional regulator of competence genes